MRTPPALAVIGPLALALSCDGAPPQVAGTPAPGDTPPVQPAAPAPDPSQCPLALTDIALYQAVKVPLVAGGAPVGDGAVDVVRRRPALVRVSGRGPGEGNEVDARVRLHVATRAGERVFEDARPFGADSDDRILDSTFDFDVPADALGDDFTISAELLAPAGCAGLRLPAAAPAPVRTRQTGVLQVRIVPLRYDADGSGRLPDTSDDQLQRFRDLLMAMYPVESVQVTVRDPVGTSITLNSSGWSDLLDSLRALRERDKPDDDIYYYGVVAPGPTFSAYCGAACIAGLAFQAEAGRAGMHVGVGVGFSGSVAADTLAHELGHEHGRGHAPCGTKTGVDTAFPYDGGGTGVWGFDARTRALIAPNRKDMMGYCSPRWISDYNYQAILERSASVNEIPRALRLASAPTTWRVLLIDAQGRARWGLPAQTAEPPGRPERATVQDATGARLDDVDVYRVSIADSNETMVLVPTPKAGWRRVQIAGAGVVELDAPSAVRALAP